MKLLDEQDGVVDRAEALTVVGHDVLDRMAGRGVNIARAFPGVFVLSALSDDRSVRRRAALKYVKGGALSHLDALDEWGLPCDRRVSGDERIHVTTSGNRATCQVRGIAMHRRKGFALGAPLTVVRNGCDVVRLEQAVVESWAFLSAAGRHAPAIVAVRERRTRAKRLLSALDSQPRTPGAAEMRQLFAKLDAGCQSELELWGHDHVFTHRSLPSSVAQFVVRAAGRVAYLDRAFPAEMVGVEMDGAAYHGDAAQRARDVRRDAWLSRLGWVVVRFTHARLVNDPAGVRSEVLAILSTRRRQLGLSGP